MGAKCSAENCCVDDDGGGNGGQRHCLMHRPAEAEVSLSAVSEDRVLVDVRSQTSDKAGEPLKFSREPSPAKQNQERPWELARAGGFGGGGQGSQFDARAGSFSGVAGSAGRAGSIGDGEDHNFDTLASNFSEVVGSASQHANGFPGLDDTTSVGDFQERLDEAKLLVKGFARQMVKGRELVVMTESGHLKTCSASLSRRLDCLRIKLGRASRSVHMVDVEEVLVGVDVEGIDTPVDELCATLVLASGECISFRLHDVAERDKFIMCLSIFSAGCRCA